MHLTSISEEVKGKISEEKDWERERETRKRDEARIARNEERRTKGSNGGVPVRGLDEGPYLEY